MRKLLFLLCTLLLVTGCEFEDVAFKGISGFRFGKLEGKELTFELDVKMENPNAFKVKVKPSMLQVFVEDQVIGNIYLLKKAKMKRKSTTEITLPMKLELENGAMFSLLKFATRETVTLRLKGKIKGGVSIFSKKVEVDKSLNVPGSKLNLQELMKGFKND